MGKLLPNHRNATFSGSGSFNPLCNDPNYETIGIGSRIFLGGAPGYIIGEGTQHDPGGRFGTLMVKGDCKKMTSEYIRGAAFTNYGNTLYVGLGVPIPILNEGLAKQTAVTDEDIFTSIVDYGVPRRSRPTLGKVSYQQLKSGSLILQNKEIKVSPLSSLKKAKEIAELLKKWINNAQFYLTSPVETLPTDTTVKPMKQTKEVIFVDALIKPAVTCLITESITEIAERLISRSVNHIIVIDDTGRLEGIVTSWDITRAIANGLTKLPNIITTRVVTSDPNEPIEAASRRMAQHNISALPVVDQNKIVLGILTSEDLSKLIGG
jgi:CBS domain-containing protein